MRKHTEEGLVLKYRNFGEADKIYTVFSKQQGKVTVLAKGVRKITSRRSGSLDVLNQIIFGIADSSRIPILTEVQIINSFPKLKHTLTGMTFGYRLVETLDKFLPEEEENQQVYKLAIDALSNMNSLNEGGKRLALSFFQYRLLIILGYDPTFGFCVSCLKDLSESWETIKFNPQMGGIVCESCLKPGTELSWDTFELLGHLKTLPFTKIQDLEIKKKDLFEVEELLSSYVEYVLELPIRSQSFFKEVK